MPYKKGPNNTLRFYSKSTGRYTKSPDSEANIISKKKMSRQEQIEYKRNCLFSHASKSKDKYVFDLFTYLEKNNPGCVILVNDKIYHKSINACREIDIMTKNEVIEVKSGKVRHHSTQFLAQKNFAEEYNKHHILYAPDISDKKAKELMLKGIDVHKSKKNIIERIKK